MEWVLLVQILQIAVTSVWTVETDKLPESLKAMEQCVEAQ